MKKTLSLVTVGAAALVIACIAFADTKAKVKWIYDGDTVLVQTGGHDIKVRVIGIDCPESKPNDKCKRDEKYGRKGCNWQVPRGKRATKRAIRLLKGKTVTLECGKKCVEVVAVDYLTAQGSAQVVFCGLV